MPAGRHVLSKEIRSKNITAIKDRNTKPEMLERRFLHTVGNDIGYTKKNRRQIRNCFRCAPLALLYNLNILIAAGQFR
jgi:DNA mismatch endonuclease Vsr